MSHTHTHTHNRALVLYRHLYEQHFWMGGLGFFSQILILISEDARDICRWFRGR